MTILEIINALLLKNRTIVYADNERCLAILSDQIPMTVHRYPSGQEYDTWIIPPQWDVKKAVLSDENGTIASYEDHPLFLAPYSCSFTGWVPREELLQHIGTSPKAPDGFFYEHRLAYDFRRRLKEWRISLPEKIIKRLDKPRYHVDIQIETKPGQMLVGESTIHGAYDHTFAFLTHSCHPGQANDGLAGVAIGVELMKRLNKEIPKPKFNYQLLIMPETIGSAVYLSDKADRIGNYLGSVFIEMAGAKECPLRLGHTRRGDCYLDRVLTEVFTRHGAPFKSCTFREHWGNDELMFDSPGVGIPGGSIERGPFAPYHTSKDNLEATDEAALEEILKILMDTVRLLETDFIPRPRQKIPFYLTRFDLYTDAIYEEKEYLLNSTVLEHLWSGLSVLDIATKLRLPYDRVLSYVKKLVDHNLVEASPVTPAYARLKWRTLKESEA